MYRSNLNVLVFPLKEGQTEEQFLSKNIEILPQRINGYKLLYNEILVGVNQRQINVISYELVDKNALLSGQIGITFSNRNAYIITCLSDRNQFDTYKPIFEKIMESISIGK